jgi:hypothetical protein
MAPLFVVHLTAARHAHNPYPPSPTASTPSHALQEEECEHLRSIIKEMSHSRQAVAKTKVELEEQYAALQREYFRWGHKRGGGAHSRALCQHAYVTEGPGPVG